MKRSLMLFLLIPSAVFAAQYNISIPTDSRATYTVIQKGSQGVLKTIVTKREGSSGTTFSERLYDCENGTVKYIGTGDTIEQMRSSSPDPNMSPVVDKSIAFYIGKEACK